MVFWTDFPFALSFDCLDGEMARIFGEQIEGYFQGDYEDKDK